MKSVKPFILITARIVLFHLDASSFTRWHSSAVHLGLGHRWWWVVLGKGSFWGIIVTFVHSQEKRAKAKGATSFHCISERAYVVETVLELCGKEILCKLRHILRSEFGSQIGHRDTQSQGCPFWCSRWNNDKRRQFSPFWLDLFSSKSTEIFWRALAVSDPRSTPATPILRSPPGAQELSKLSYSGA